MKFREESHEEIIVNVGNLKSHLKWTFKGKRQIGNQDFPLLLYCPPLSLLKAKL